MAYSNIYLSYSGWNLHRGCDGAYWHRYINKTKTPPDNRVNMLYGESVGILFEKFYTDRLWKGLKTPEEVTAKLLARVDQTMDAIVQKESMRGGIWDWTQKNLKPGNRSFEEVKAEVKETIPRGVAIIRHHRLLGTKTGAEVKLDVTIGGARLGGRADFLIGRTQPHNDLVLIDGKGSRYRDKYVSRSQLVWYAMLHQELRGHLPDKLGFLFWRYEPEESMDWVEFTQKDIDILKETVLDSIKKIEDGKRQMLKQPGEATLKAVFPVKPGSDCKFCSYLTGCPQGQAFLEKKAPVPEGIGVEDIGLE